MTRVLVEVAIEILEKLIILIPVLVAIAMTTIIERKGMGSMQRRLGPITTGLKGVGQPFSDGLKLVVKQLIMPSQSYSKIFIISPIISLALSLLIWVVLPIQPDYGIWELDHSILLVLAISSLAIYGILLSGWSGSSKYSILGSFRSSAQMISYELSITLLIILIITGDSYGLSDIIQSQSNYYNLITHLPIGLIYFITILAETNRAPFDLPEAESELVSGFNTEHSSMPFALFFLAEYGFMISQSLIFTILFLGGPFLPLIQYSEYLYSTITILKTLLVLFTFILIRACLPRFRYDLLQDFAWNTILPIVLVYLLLEITIIYI